MNFVLFGLGRAGTIHANNLLRHPVRPLFFAPLSSRLTAARQLAKVLYIVELDVAKAKAFVAAHADKLADCQVLHPDDKAKALADPRVHAAMCASTTSTHEGIIRACFEHHKVGVVCGSQVRHLTLEVALLHGEARC